MNAREELNRIKNLYKESNKYILKLSYEDIGILITIIDALDKREKMNKLKCASLYGVINNKSNMINTLKIKEKIESLELQCKLCNIKNLIDCKTQCTIGGTKNILKELMEEN